MTESMRDMKKKGSRERSRLIRYEVKKNIISIYFVISVFLLYAVFMLGDSGCVLQDGTSTTIIGAIWNKLHGNWLTGSDSSYLVRMNAMWSDNSYLPVLMPFICGLAGAVNVMEEMQTGNKRLVFIRCSRVKYFSAKVLSNSMSSVLVALNGISLYYITLFLFFDRFSRTDDVFQIVYFVFSGEMVMDAGGVSMQVVIFGLLKGILYFCLYAVMSGSFSYFMAVWCRDKYIAFGGMIFLCYVQSRIVEELIRKYVTEGMAFAGTLSDLLNPIFLHYAGNAGFYEDKEGIAVLLAIVLTSLCYTMTYRKGGLC